jgi:hypothetical protein
MDEMTLLEDFRAAVAPPSEAVLARARAGMTDGARGLAYPGRRRLHRPRTRGKLTLTGLAGLAAATAVAVALATAGSGGEVAPATASLVVKELAYRAAAAAAAAPAVAPGQWVYWQEKRLAHADLLDTYEVWTTADATKAAYLSQGKVTAVPCPGPDGKPASACQYVGQPIILHFGHKDSTGELVQRMPVSYASLGSLPRDPAALGRYLASLPLPGFRTAPVREFEIIKELLTTYVMPPALTAELYRALGAIPGVTVDRHATDIAGRHGTGLRITLPPSKYKVFDELILDSKTFAVMGQQIVFGPGRPAKVSGIVLGTAVLKSALVSGPGQRP